MSARETDVIVDGENILLDDSIEDEEEVVTRKNRK